MNQRLPPEFRMSPNGDVWWTSWAASPVGALLQRVANTMGVADDSGTEDDLALAALKARITAIIEAAAATGSLDEKALAELPAPLAEELRTAWTAQSKPK